MEDVIRIDLSYKARLEPETGRMMHEAAKETVASYMDLTGKVADKLMDDKDWWVSGPASRNTLASPIFHHMSCLNFLRKWEEMGRRRVEVTTESRALARVILKNFEGKASVKVKTRKFFRAKRVLNCLYTPVSLLSMKLFALLSDCGKREVFVDGKPILLDTFVMPGYVDKDRYYTGMENFLNEEEKKDIRYVPSWINYSLSRGLEFFKSLRNSTRKFLLKEDYLKWADYFYAFGHFIRARFIKISRIDFMGMDISGLFKEDLLSLAHYHSACEGLLNDRFARRLCAAGVKPRLVVDWFENQPVDKGWSLGFSTFYPGVDTKGYEGYVAFDMYLCKYPIPAELKAGVVPKTIAVPGRKVVEDIGKYCPEIRVELAPSFRYGKVFSARQSQNKNNTFTIFVALPVVAGESVFLLETLEKGLACCKYKDIIVLAKTHPGVNEKIIRNAFPKMKGAEFKLVVGGDIYDYLDRADVFISSLSSSSLEAVARGVPVIIIDDQGGLNNPFPSDIDRTLWKLCLDENDVANALKYFMDMRDKDGKFREESGEKIKKEYFLKPDRENVRKFLEMGNP